MAEPETKEDTADEAPKKSSKKGLLIGLVLALLLGGGGFFAAYTGVVGSASSQEDAHTEDPQLTDLPPVAFVEMEPLVVSLGKSGATRHLRFRASLEVVPGHEADVQNVLPRVVDVLNSYLRAVELPMLEHPAALIQLRAQMLRRIQLVTGEGRVRDLLILEFVLN